jgi:hypothetical protein
LSLCTSVVQHSTPQQYFTDTSLKLPKPEEVISRVIHLVKPGGWLLLEDMNFNPRDEDGLELGPATKTWYEIYHSTMKSRGVENVFPPFESTINASGLFSEINARTVVLSVSEKSDGESDT